MADRPYDLCASGDLQELYVDKIVHSGRLSASFWIWRQVLRSVPRFFIHSFIWSLDMLKNYLKVTLRNIQKHKGYSFINIAGLAVGMACCILILLWVQDELSYDRFHENADQIYRLVTETPYGRSRSSAWALMPALKQDFPDIIKGSWYSEVAMLTSYGNDRYYEQCAFVGPEFIEMFTFPFIHGDPGSAFSDVNSVVLTEEAARRYFRDSDPMGKIIRLDNRIDLEVTGVIENVPPNSHMQFDLLAHPVAWVGERRMRTWSADCPAYVLLHPNANTDDVRQKIAGTINKYDKRTNVEYFVDIQLLNKIHLYALNGPDPIIYVYIFSSIAVIVLLIACINFMNLSTARSVARAKEVGMRKVAGAAKGDIIKQFYGESITLSFIALVFATILVYLFLPVFNNMASKQLTLNISGNVLLLFGLILIGLITGILSGIYPAFFLSAFQPIQNLNRMTAKGSKGDSLRKILIVAQFTAAIILIVSTSVVYRQMHYIRTKDLGFNKEQIVMIRMNREVRNSYQTIKEILVGNSDIINVSAASSIPLAIGNGNPVYWTGRSSDDYVSMNFVCVDYDYFETFDMDMAHGRPFSKEYPTDARNYIINEAALKLTGYEDPIGRMFSMWTDEGDIVGVVKDFHATSLHNEIQPIVFLLYQNLPYFYMYVKMRPSNMPGTIEFIKDTMSRQVPGFLFEYRFLDDYFHEQYVREERIGEILKYFSFLAIFISCLGLFGLASFMAEKRTKEIAIRKVLGASHTGILSILVREFVALITIANVIAWPVAYLFMNKWMQGFTFHTTIGLWLFAVAGFLALIIALLTVSYQTLKAARANPVEALKFE